MISGAVALRAGETAGDQSEQDREKGRGLRRAHCRRSIRACSRWSGKIPYLRPARRAPRSRQDRRGPETAPAPSSNHKPAAAIICTRISANFKILATLALSLASAHSPPNPETNNRRQHEDADGEREQRPGIAGSRAGREPASQSGCGRNLSLKSGEELAPEQWGRSGGTAKARETSRLDRFRMADNAHDAGKVRLGHMVEIVDMVIAPLSTLRFGSTRQ